MADHIYPYIRHAQGSQMMFQTRFLFALGVVLFLPMGLLLAGPVTVDNHSFESNAAPVNGTATPTAWTIIGGGGGGVLNGFASVGLSPRPDGTAQNAWSNGGNFFQSLGTAVAPNTTYTLTVDVGDRSDGCCSFPLGTEIRVGSGAAFGTNYLSYTNESRPAVPNGGWTTWSATFDSGPTPTAGALRIELINPGGVQPQFDNVRLDEAATPAPGPGPRDIYVRNHSFQLEPVAVNSNTNTPALFWTGANGATGVLNGFAAQGLEPRPDGTTQNLFSNGGDLFQVTQELIAADTLYTLTVDLGDRSDTDFPAGAEIRLGAGNAFGTNLLTPDELINPTPDAGWETWTFSAMIEDGDPLIGQPLRIELLGGSVQSQFDNVRLTATSAAVPEPASVVVWSLIGLGLAGFRNYHRRKKEVTS